MCCNFCSTSRLLFFFLAIPCSGLATFIAVFQNARLCTVMQIGVSLKFADIQFVYWCCDLSLVVFHPWSLKGPSYQYNHSVPWWTHPYQCNLAPFNFSSEGQPALGLSEPHFISCHGVPCHLTLSTSSFPWWRAYWYLFLWLACSSTLNHRI